MGTSMVLRLGPLFPNARVLFALTVFATCASLLRMILPLWSGSAGLLGQSLETNVPLQPQEKYKERMMMHGQKKKIITRDAQVPFQFKFHICNGLTNQKLQLLDGTLAGLFLGAQIVLPKTIVLNGAQFVSVTDQNRQPLDHIFNMTRFETMIQQVQLGPPVWFPFFLTRKINIK